MVLSIDAPSKLTGTGEVLVADGEDVAMIRATLVDANGLMVPSANNNMTFSVVSGPGKVWTTHNGDPGNLSPNNASWNPAYHGLARAFIRSTSDHASTSQHRRRMRQIDLEPTVYIAGDDKYEDPDPIVVEVVVDGFPSARLEIPVTADPSQLPLAVAARSMRRV